MQSSLDILSLVFRAISFVLLLQVAGTAIFIAIFGRLLPGSLDSVRRVGWWLAMTAMLFVVAHYVLEAARMTGEMSGALDPSMQMMALRSSAGAAFALRMVGLALIVIGLRKRGVAPATSAAPVAAGVTATVTALLPAASEAASAGAGVVSSSGAAEAATAFPVPFIAVIGAFLAVAAFALTGHTSVRPYRPLVAAILLSHLLVVAFWFGALWPLYLATLREPATTAASAIDAFSAVAVWMVPVIAFAGMGLAAFLLPDLDALSQPYGRLLLLKIGGFAVLMGLAALNKWTFGPDIARANPGAARGFRTTVAIEYLLICAVLVVTAIMTAFYSPEPP
jgi:hypothetical protein